MVIAALGGDVVNVVHQGGKAETPGTYLRKLGNICFETQHSKIHEKTSHQNHVQQVC